MRQELNITPIIANTDIYRKHWVEHLLRTGRSQIQKITFEHNPKAETRGQHCEVGTQQRPNP